MWKAGELIIWNNQIPFEFNPEDFEHRAIVGNPNCRVATAEEKKQYYIARGIVNRNEYEEGTGGMVDITDDIAGAVQRNNERIKKSHQEDKEWMDGWSRNDAYEAYAKMQRGGVRGTLVRL